MRTALNNIKKERISITVDSTVLEKIKMRAMHDDRSLSQYINLILRKAAESEEEA